MRCATIYLEGRNKKEGYKYLKKTIYRNITISFIRKNLDNDIHKITITIERGLGL